MPAGSVDRRERPGPTGCTDGPFPADGAAGAVGPASGTPLGRGGTATADLAAFPDDVSSRVGSGVAGCFDRRAVTASVGCPAAVVAPGLMVGRRTEGFGLAL